MKRKVIILATIVICISIGLVALWRWASGPVESTITANPPQQSTANTLQQMDTEYFYTHLPTDYRVEKESKLQGPLVRISATQQTAKGLQVGITSAVLPTGGIQEVADYHLRTTQKELYATLDLSPLPQYSKAFITTPGTTPIQVTVFMEHAGHYASVTVSSYSNTKDMVIQRLQQIIADWNWK